MSLFLFPLSGSVLPLRDSRCRQATRCTRRIQALDFLLHHPRRSMTWKSLLLENSGGLLTTNARYCGKFGATSDVRNVLWPSCMPPEVITIFSAPNYCDVYNNKAGCLLRMDPVQVLCSKKRPFSKPWSWALERLSWASSPHLDMRCTDREPFSSLTTAP